MTICSTLDAHPDFGAMGTPGGLIGAWSQRSTTAENCAPGADRNLRAPRIADEIWMGRWLLYRIAEDFEVDHTRRQARAGRLERGRCPHELLHQRHSREL